jgi:folate-binding protein YgfZ
MTDQPTPDQREQYASVRDSAGVARLDRRSQLELSGNDRSTFLNAFCTADIGQLTEGQGCEAFITSVQGKTLGLVNIFCQPNSLLLETEAGEAQKLISHLDRYVIREQVEFTDLSDSLESILLAGPGAADQITPLLPSPLPTKPLDHLEQPYEGQLLSIRRCPEALNGFWIAGSTESIELLENQLVEGGCCRLEQAVVEILRIEAGIPRFGVDLDEGNLPQEVNRNAEAISFTKGCYLGQETVARIDALGHVNSLLTGLVLPAGPLPAAGTTFEQDGSEAARITSSCHSLRLGRPLALAYLRRQFSAPGTVVGEGNCSAEVISLPLES